MTRSLRLAAPNSLLLVLDPDSGVAPDSMLGGAIAASSSGLAIGTVAEIDGEALIHLGEPDELPRDAALVLRWEGTLETSGRLAVVTVHNEVVLEESAVSVMHVQVWTNDPSEPDEIWVVADRADGVYSPGVDPRDRS